MHNSFADWYQPVTFNHNRDIIEPRWTGIENVFNILDTQMVSNLVRFVFDESYDISNSLDDFKLKFKDADPTFPSSGNDEEVKVLSGSVLALICLDDTFDIEKQLTLSTVLSILTASVGHLRKPLVNIDLVGMAESSVHENAIFERERPEWASNFEEDDTVDDDDEDAEEENFGKEVTIEINSLRKAITIQDEELQILWWLIGGWSSLWNNSFKELESDAKSILLSKEISNMTRMVTEPPSLKSIFTHVLDGETKKVTIPNAIKASDLENLKILKKGENLCPIIYPLHLAVERAVEAEGDRSWASIWSKLTKIHQNKKFTPIELSLQLFREHKLIDINEA